jgi:hypothetical protein
MVARFPVYSSILGQHSYLASTPISLRFVWSSYFPALYFTTNATATKMTMRIIYLRDDNHDGSDTNTTTVLTTLMNMKVILTVLWTPTSSIHTTITVNGLFLTTVLSSSGSLKYSTCLPSSRQFLHTLCKK